MNTTSWETKARVPEKDGGPGPGEEFLGIDTIEAIMV